jgi:hypothetical protein
MAITESYLGMKWSVIDVLSSNNNCIVIIWILNEIGGRLLCYTLYTTQRPPSEKLRHCGWKLLLIRPIHRILFCQTFSFRICQAKDRRSRVRVCGWLARCENRGIWAPFKTRPWKRIWGMADVSPEMHRLSRFIFSRELNNDIFLFLIARSDLVMLTKFADTREIQSLQREL